MLTQIRSLNLISSGQENVLENFDKANQNAVRPLLALVRKQCQGYHQTRFR